MPDAYEPALTLRFSVQLGAHKLEHVTACEGLEAQYEVEEYKEAGNREYVHKLPLGVTYTNVRLTRPVDADSGKIASWFSEARTTLRRSTATIIACDGNGAEVARWELQGVWPVRYTGPHFSSSGTTAASETIELSHNGFTVTAA